MAIANHKSKWLFLMEPHTASRAVTAALPQVGGVRCGHHHIDIATITRRDRAEISAKKIGEYKVIAAVRNPFDMVITRYKAAKSDLSFHEWVMKMMGLNRLEPSNGLEATATHFVYYEHLAEDLETTFGRPIDLGYDDEHKTVDKEPWQTYYHGEGSLVKALTIHWFPYLMKYGYDVNPPDDFELPARWDDSEIEVVIKQDVRDRMVKPI